MNRLRHSRNIVRIHHQRIAQLDRRPGKLAQHQHTVLIVARGHKLLGHQVHPIVQRRHQANIRCAIPPCHLVVTAMAINQDDWLPSRSLKTQVDARAPRLQRVLFRSA